MVNPNVLGESILQALTLGIMLVGLFGLLVPVFPGLLIIWLASCLYALLENTSGRMHTIDWFLFAVITVLMIVGSIIDNIIIARQMRGKAIPWTSIALAFLIGLVASLFFTPIIGLLASPLGLFGVEWLRLRRGRAAFDSARSYMVAWGWSFAAIFGIGLLMIVVWALWAFF